MGRQQLHALGEEERYSVEGYPMSRSCIEHELGVLALIPMGVITVTTFAARAI